MTALHDVLSAPSVIKAVRCRSNSARQMQLLNASQLSRTRQTVVIVPDTGAVSQAHIRARLYSLASGRRREFATTRSGAHAGHMNLLLSESRFPTTGCRDDDSTRRCRGTDVRSSSAQRRVNPARGSTRTAIFGMPIIAPTSKVSSPSRSITPVRGIGTSCTSPTTSYPLEMPRRFVAVVKN